MRNWIPELSSLAASATPVVLLTIANVRGSAPREVGARMLVTANETIGTIGGGQLEYQCVNTAVSLLQNFDEYEDEVSTRKFSLGANCGQCCGGVVDVLFEVIADANVAWVSSIMSSYEVREPMALVTGLSRPHHRYLLTDADCRGFNQAGSCPTDIQALAKTLLAKGLAAEVVDNYLIEPILDSEFDIAIFGAGHVGAATVDVLSRLDCSIRWIDGRRNIFPAQVPENVTCIGSFDPAREVAAMPAGSYFLVMTHSHPLDQEICHQVLSRNDYHYCGLIGSAAKRRRFERLLLKQGLTEAQLKRLTCPIGVTGISGKKPVEIAISVTAEVMQAKDLGVNVRHGPMLREVRS